MFNKFLSHVRSLKHQSSPSAAIERFIIVTGCLMIAALAL